MQLTQKRVERKKRIDDKTLVKNQKNILTLANVYAYIYMYTDWFNGYINV